MHSETSHCHRQSSLYPQSPLTASTTYLISKKILHSPKNRVSHKPPQVMAAPTSISKATRPERWLPFHSFYCFPTTTPIFLLRQHSSSFEELYWVITLHFTSLQPPTILLITFVWSLKTSAHPLLLFTWQYMIWLNDQSSLLVMSVSTWLFHPKLWQFFSDLLPSCDLVLYSTLPPTSIELDIT